MNLKWNVSRLISVCLFQPRDVTNFTVGGFAPMSPRISSPMHHGGGGEWTRNTRTFHAAAVFLYQHEETASIAALLFGCFWGFTFNRLHRLLADKNNNAETTKVSWDCQWTANNHASNINSFQHRKWINTHRRHPMSDLWLLLVLQSLLKDTALKAGLQRGMIAALISTAKCLTSDIMIASLCRSLVDRMSGGAVSRAALLSLAQLFALTT